MYSVLLAVSTGALCNSSRMHLSLSIMKAPNNGRSRTAAITPGLAAGAWHSTAEQQCVPYVITGYRCMSQQPL